MIRAFLFDIGNVILRFDFSKALQAIAPHCKIPAPLAALPLIETLKLRYEDGQIQRAEFLKEVFQTLKYTGAQTDFIAAWQNIFTPNEPIFALIEQLAKHHPLFLLSNTSDIHIEGIFRDFPIFQRFSGATYSFSAHASKPSERIYQIAMNEHGLAPAETLFIDDLSANIATANQLGFQTHHYDFRHHQDLLAALGKKHWPS